MKKQLTNFEQHLQEKLKNKKFREAYECERRKVFIAYEIFKLREKRGFTQKELAKKLKTTQSVVARIESGDQNLTIDYLNKIADIFHKNLKIDFV
jgi:ribosome-binding protein aMBF1 (putative translation factor)